MSPCPIGMDAPACRVAGRWVVQVVVQAVLSEELLEVDAANVQRVETATLGSSAVATVDLQSDQAIV